MNKRLLFACVGMLMSVMSFAQWVQPSIESFFTADTYAKELKASEVDGDTTVYYLLNIEAPGFFSQGTCTAHAQWATHAALQTTGKKIILEKYLYTEIIQPEEGDEEAKPDTIVHPWDGKTYTLSDYGNYNSRGNMYYNVFPTNWYAMFVDRNGQADYMWEVLPQGNGVYYIKVSDYNPNYNDSNIGELLGYPDWISYLGFNAMDVDYVDRSVMALTPMLNPNITDEEIEASETFLNYMYGMDAKIKWAFIPEDQYAKYNDAIAAYNYAETFLANIEAIEAEYPSVNTDAARAVYNNYNVSTLAEMQAAEEELEEQVHQIKLSYLEGATRENPVDASLLITNPTFDTIGDFTGWSGTAFGAGGTTSTCAEHYNKTFDTYQDIKRLPAGFYRFSVSGFYRRGSSDNDWALQTSENPDASRNAIFYVVVGEDTTSVAIAAASSGAVSTSFGGATSSVGSGLVIPNTMESGNYWFQAGYYDNYVTLLLDEDADVRIGVKKSVSISTDWALFDNFAILYFGTIDGDPEYVLLQNLVDELDLQYPNEEEVYANAEVKSDFFSKLEEARDATENFTEMRGELEAAASALAASVADYKLVKSALDRCTSEQERFEGTAWEGLGEEFGDLGTFVLEEGYINGNVEELLAEEPYELTIVELSDFMDQMIIDYITENVKPGDEITLLINNPAFDSNFSGWTKVSGSTPAWGGNKGSQGTNKAVNYETGENYVDMELTGGCAEVYHATFDIQQVVKNLPKGSYTLTVQAFSRHDDDKYQADFEEGPEEGVTAVIYCNEFEKKVQNILGSAQPWPIFGYDSTNDFSYDPNDPDSYTKGGWAGDTYLAGYGFFPNGMEGANYHFNVDKKNYENRIDFVLTEDGEDITIGIKNTATDSWVLFDNFRLYYNGSGKEVFEDIVNGLKADLATITAEDKRAGDDAKTSASTAIDDLTEVMANDEKTADDALEAIAAANEVLKYGKTSIELYSELNEAISNIYAAVEAAFDYLPEEYIAEASEMGDDASDVYEKGTQVNDEVEETIKALNEKTDYLNNSVTLHNDLADAVSNLEEAITTYGSTASASILEGAREARSAANAALEGQNDNETVQGLIDKANAYTGMLGAPDRSAFLPADVASATAAEPVNVSGVIVNATFDTVGDFTGWSGTAFGAGGTTSTNAEHYNKTYDTYQDIAGLPAGYYVATVQGYYRHGSNTNDWTLYNSEDNTAGTQAYFYATSGAEHQEVAVKYASSDAMPVDSTWRQGVEAGDGMYIPNTMAQAKVWFDRKTDTPENQYVDGKAYYNNFLPIYVDETGFLRIGVKKTAKINSNDWSIYDNFQLYYVGSEEPDFSTAIKTVDAAPAATAVQGIYNLQGQKLGGLQKGLNIVNGKKVLVK